MGMETIWMWIAIVVLAATVYLQNKMHKTIEKNYSDGNNQFEIAAIIRALAILSECGFPSEYQDAADRNILYYKMAMRLKGYDLKRFEEHDYEYIKAFMTEDIPLAIPTDHHGQYDDFFNHILPFAIVIRNELEKIRG